MSTRLTLKGDPHTWYPNPVYVFEGHLSQLLQPVPGLSPTRCRGVAKNVAYTLQQLEFLAQAEIDLKLSDVLTRQNYKSFVIHGCAVLEAIFYYVLVSSGKAATTLWASEGKVTSPEFNLNGRQMKQETEFFTKLPQPALQEMTFDGMCKRVESKKLIKLGNDFYRNLPYLRALRNRVHIHGIENANDTDYLKFNSRDFRLIKSTLKALLTCHLFPSVDAQLDLTFLD